MVSAKGFISYIRVSTKKQGSSGLGLEGQQQAVKDYIAGQGGKLVKEYREVESGKAHTNRPALTAALAHAKRNGAVLVVAKLDRLSRNVGFLASLMDAGVDFVCCDNPHATKFTIHILSAVAQYEREQTSARTKSALAALKARGVQLGSNRPGHWTPERHALRVAALERGRIRAAETNRKRAGADYDDLLPSMRELRESGKTLSQIATILNEQGHTTRRRTPFTPSTVKRILDRSAKAQ